MNLAEQYDIEAYQKAPLCSMGAWEYEKGAELLIKESYQEGSLRSITKEAFERLLSKHRCLQHYQYSQQVMETTLDYLTRNNYINIKGDDVEVTESLLINQKIPRR